MNKMDSLYWERVNTILFPIAPPAQKQLKTTEQELTIMLQKWESNVSIAFSICINYWESNSH